MNKKGFTLIELIAVIIILSLLAFLTTTSVSKFLDNSKNKLSEIQIELIRSAAENWGAKNVTLLPDVDKCGYITLQGLKNNGVFEDDLNNNSIPNDLKIKIITTKNTLGKIVTHYQVNPESIVECEKIDI